MTQIVTAVYENGILRPLQPLPLSEQQTVRLQLLPDASPEEEEKEIILLLVRDGLMRPRAIPEPLPPNPVSVTKRQELAQVAGQVPGKPLSELVIEERGEW